MLKILSSTISELASLKDSELIKTIQQNDFENCRIQVDELYRRHSSDVYRMTRSLFSHDAESIADAEDLFQEAWRLALERIKRFDLNAANNFGAWVKGFADNLFLEGYRATAKIQSANNEIGYLMTKGENNEPIVEDSIEENEPEADSNKLINKEYLLIALDCLTATEREIFVEWHRTFDRNDPGKKEHADNLDRLSAKFGIQKGSLRKIKQRALEKIQKKLNL